MLVLSHSKRLRIDLHKFRKRIHKTSSDRNRSTYRNIIVRELFTRNFRCRIYRCSVFTDDKHSYILRERHPPYELLCLPAGCSVSYSNHLNSIFLHHCRDCLNCLDLLICRRMRKDSLIMQQISLTVQTYNLAACPETGINSKNILLSHRRCKQKLTKVVSENPY